MKKCNKCKRILLDDETCGCSLHYLQNEDYEIYEIYGRTIEDVAEEYAIETGIMPNDEVPVMIDGDDYTITAEPQINYRLNDR